MNCSARFHLTYEVAACLSLASLNDAVESTDTAVTVERWRRRFLTVAISTTSIVQSKAFETEQQSSSTKACQRRGVAREHKPQWAEAGAAGRPTWWEKEMPRGWRPYVEVFESKEWHGANVVECVLDACLEIAPG